MCDNTPPPEDLPPDRTEDTLTMDAGGSSAPQYPSQIDRYRILGIIGEGGMGTVYEAEQDKPKRSVALKVIKAGIATKERLRRFELESKFLGRLRHPGIAQVYEAGTADTGYGPQPYFAMEYIRGRSLLRHVGAEKLGTRRKLELLAQVCDAVQHAHQKGVIHRDLKPGNIQVDELGQPKILDFGVARATDSDVQATLNTNIGALVGTIPYMSPEQVKAEPDELDTRSDVYALGVILYEMLTGKLPYDVRKKPIPEAARMIAEDEPASLSTVNSVFRGDVETIVATALEKDKSQRYASAAELAADIRRYLDDQPISARPPSASYHFKKFARRNKALVGGVVAVFVVLAAGIIASATQAQRATREAHTAAQEASKSAAVNTFLNDMLSAASPMELTRVDTLRGRKVTVIEILHEAASELETGELEDQPLVEATVRWTLGKTYRDLGDYTSAHRHLSRSLEIRREHLGNKHLETAASLNLLGELHHSRSELAEGEPLLREALAVRREILGSSHADVARSQRDLADLLHESGEYEEAESLYVSALAIQKAELGEEDTQTAETMNGLAGILQNQGRLDEAEPLLRNSLGVRRRILGEEHPAVAGTLHDLGLMLKAQGRLHEAEEAMRSAIDIWRGVLGNEHSYLSSSLVMLGVLLKDQGRLAEAEPLYRQALAIQRKTLGDEHTSVGASLYNLAKLLQAQGKLVEAETRCREALKILAKLLPDDHPSLAGIRSGLGSILTDLRRPAEAEPLLRRAIEVYDAIIPGKWQGHQVRSLLGAAVLGQKRFSEAELLLVESYNGLKDDPRVTADRKRQALERILQLYKQWDEAAPGTGKNEKAVTWREKFESQLGR